MVKAYCNACKRLTTMRIQSASRMRNNPSLRSVTGKCSACHGGVSSIAKESAVTTRAESVSPKKPHKKSPKKNKKSPNKKNKSRSKSPAKKHAKSPKKWNFK